MTPTKDAMEKARQLAATTKQIAEVNSKVNALIVMLTNSGTIDLEALQASYQEFYRSEVETIDQMVSDAYTAAQGKPATEKKTFKQRRTERKQK